MLNADMMEGANQTAFKDAEKALNRISMNFAPHIFFVAMGHNLVSGELRPDNPVLPRVIRHQMSVRVNMVFKVGLQGLGAHAWDMEGTDFAVALHQGQDRIFMPVPFALLGSGLCAYKSFIGFNRIVPAKHFVPVGFHGFSDSVSHEPSRLVGNPKHPVKLVGAYPLLARGHKVKSQKPFVQFNMGVFKDSSHSNSERLSAGIALIKPWPMALAPKFGDLLSRATMRTNRAAWPAQFFQMSSGRFLIGENWVGKVCAHGKSPSLWA
jgi:hypothetical protein